jgi:hypothetical protein
MTIFQKGAYYEGIKVFNGLPVEIKELSYNPKEFKLQLKKYLLLHSFYTLEEYFEFKE